MDVEKDDAEEVPDVFEKVELDEHGGEGRKGDSGDDDGDV